jgi:cation diffusion facilitator family transporter
MEEKNRTKTIRKILIYILGLNWFVSFVKLFFGSIIKSSSMTADGFHSFSDGMSNIIGLLGIWIASRPKDISHPYGHKKYETFASSFIAFLLFLVAFKVIFTSIRRIFMYIEPKVTFLSFGVMFFTIAINLIVARYEYRKGKKLGSDILIADSLHTKADILTSLSVILALICVRLGLPFLDPIAALFIAIFIAYSGFHILKESSSVLCDSSVIESKRIEEVVMGIDEVVSVHKIRTRGRRDDIYVDLHVLVRADMHIDKAHHLSQKIEKEIKNRIAGVSDVVVHMEPYLI